MILDSLGDQVLPSAKVLTDGEIILTPGSLPEDIELVMKFALGDRYNQTPEEHLVKGLELCQYLWIGKANGVIGGVIMICFLDKLNWWTLDAYKNNEHDNREGDFSYRAGKLVTNWFFENFDSNEIHTIHRTDNRGATKVCERLGFSEKHVNPEFVYMRMRRPHGA